jgi:hypothetical protein
VAAACADIGLPGDLTVPTADLLVLGMQVSAPAPAPAAFYVPNDRATVRTIRHPDAFNTLYLELRFPAGALESLNGTALAPDDSVEIAVQPLTGRYGFALSASGLAFSAAHAPSALLSFGRYADPADGAAAFGETDGYLAALALWTEVGLDRWAVARGSGPAGVDEIRALIDAPGSFLLAAVPP